jgi:hypothetical protein
MKTKKILAGLAVLMAAGLTAHGQNFPLCRPRLGDGRVFQGRDSQIVGENPGATGPQRQPPSSYTFTTVEDPIGAGYGIAFGVEGDLIVGEFVAELGVSVDGYVYNDRDQTWTTLNDPLAVNLTVIANIWENDLIGFYVNSENNCLSFLYDGRTWTALEDPLAAPGYDAGTYAQGIQGDSIVGYYIDASGLYHGFLYRIHNQSWTTLDDPLAGTAPANGEGTVCEGICGDKIIGQYTDSGGFNHGFIYDGRTWATLDNPLAGTAPGQGTAFLGVSGDDEVGIYIDSSGDAHGFIYDGFTWTPLDDPEAASLGTVPTNGDGSNIVGYYYDSTGRVHGFLAKPACGP